MPSEADIPEVEREIRPVGALIAGHYEAPARAAVDETVDGIDARELEESNAEEIALLVAAMLLLMRRKVEAAPIGSGRRQRVRAAAQRLIEEGGAAVGGFRRTRPRGPTVARFVREMEASVWAESRWRIESATVEDRTRKAFRKAQETLREETKDQERQEDERQAREDARSEPGETSRPSRRPTRPESRRRDPGPLPESVRRELIRDLTRAGHVARRDVHDVIADAWAYRVYNVGRYLAMRDRQVREFVAYNNPPLGPDSKTTRFCRSIHRKVVKVERIEKSLDDYLAAVKAGDRTLAHRSFPMSTLGKVKTAEDFSRVRGLAGLPPYHYRCRTIIADARVARLGLGDVSRRIAGRS